MKHLHSTLNNMYLDSGHVVNQLESKSCDKPIRIKTMWLTN